MLSQYNPVDIEIILREENPPPPFPPATDRAAWNVVRQVIGEDSAQQIIREAEEFAEVGIPVLPASLFLEFKRIGERRGYQDPMSERRAMQTALALAECLEFEGRFLDPLMDLTWAICEESTWAYPAHASDLADMTNPYIDLGAAQTGSQLAELDLILGAELDPMVGKRIRHEVDQRLLTPYLTRHDHWWLYNTAYRRVNNWTAVCNGNIVLAAIHLEDDLARLAEIIARAARSLDDYLETFDVDGGSSEGPGYWGYGFGNYVLMAQMIEQRSNGRLAFLDGDLIRNVAQFPLKTMLSQNNWVNFSDASLTPTFPGSLLVHLAQRLDLPRLLTLHQQQNQRGVADRRWDIAWGLRELFWRADHETPAEPVYVAPNPHDWYSEMHWMIARYNPSDPDALVLAAKAGHNGEMHNQNDVGSFIVQTKGDPVIADLGSGRYTRDYFNERRYEHFVCQSLGHSCPVPNGQMQGPFSRAAHTAKPTPEQDGANFYSTLLEHHADESLDMLKFEMKDVYPAKADLESLVRTIMLHREEPSGWVELIDNVHFASGPGTFESVLTTFGEAELGDGAVLLKGDKGKLHVAYDEDVVKPRIDVVSDVDLVSGLCDVQRVVFEWIRPQQTGSIVLGITPID